MSQINFPSPHLDEVIKTIMKIVKFDIDFYKDIIVDFLKNYNISKKENIKVLLDLLSYEDGTNPYKYYGKDSDGIITLHHQKEKTIEIDIQDYSLKGVGEWVKNVISETNETETEIRTELLQYLNEIKFCEHRKVREYILQHPNPFFINKDDKFWLDYIYSIVKAEYLFDDEYSKKLKETIAEIKNYSGANSLTTNSFYLVKSFIRVSWLVLEFCDKNKNSIQEQEDAQEHIVVNTDRKLRFISDFPNISFNVGKQTARTWERLFESVVEMTDIDHRYVATEKNIDRLLILWANLGVLENKIEEKLYGAIKIKTAELLTKILEALKNRHIVLNQEENLEELIVEFTKKMKVCNFVNNRKKIIQPPENYHPREESYSDTDIIRYDNYIRKGVNQYYQNQPLYKEKNPTFDDIKNFVAENRLITSQRLIVDLFENVCKETSDKIKETNADVKDIEDRLSILGDIIQQLEGFIEKYKTNKIPSFRPLSEESFYKIDDNNLVPTNEIIKKIEKEKEIIFFASAGLMPIDIKWLEDKKREFANKFRKLDNEIYNRMIVRILEAQNEIKNEQKNKQKKLDDDIKDGQRNNIITLSVFAGLITFVTGSVAFFRVETKMGVELLFYYSIFALILIVSLGLFAIFLRELFHSKNNRSKNEEIKNDNWQKKLCRFIKKHLCPLSIFLIIIIALTTKFFYFDGKINKLGAEKQDIVEKTAETQNDDSSEGVVFVDNE